MIGSVEGFHPECGRYSGVKKECAHNVVCGPNESFGAAVLGRSVGAGQTKGDAVGGEESAQVGGEKFTTIVTLHAADCFVKLCVNVEEEILEYLKSI
jgi:hypothetical protein